MDRSTDIGELSAADIEQVSGAGMSGTTYLTAVTKVSNVYSRKSGEGQQDHLQPTTTWSDVGQAVLVAGASTTR